MATEINDILQFIENWRNNHTIPENVELTNEQITTFISKLHMQIMQMKPNNPDINAWEVVAKVSEVAGENAVYISNLPAGELIGNKNMKRRKEEMGFVNEQVGEENKDLWESIGWKDWSERPLGFRAKRYWCADKNRNIYLQAIGGFIDMPNYYDLAYKGKIVRMEIGQHGNGNRATGFSTVWLVKHIYMPKSLWDEKEDIILAIKEAFLANRSGRSESIVKSIDVEFGNEPECVEADYNGQ